MLRSHRKPAGALSTVQASTVAGILSLAVAGVVHADSGVLITPGSAVNTPWENSDWYDPVDRTTPVSPAPGATSGTTNTDTVTLEGSGQSSHGLSLLVDDYRNLQNIVLIHGNGTSLSGGTLYLTGGGSITRSSTIGGGGGAGGQVGNQINSNIVLLGDYTFENNANTRFLKFGAANTIIGTAGDGENQTLTLGGSSTIFSAANTAHANIVHSAIGDGGNGGTLSLNKTGASTWVLDGANTYSGTTTVTQGALLISNRNALYGGNTASWTNSNISVASGARMGVRVGGDSNISDLDVQKLIGVGFASGSSFVFDTGKGDYTYSFAITNPGGNSLGLVKSGSNKLTLTASSSYTGETRILENAGILRVEADGALGTGQVFIESVGSGGTVTGGILELAGNITLANSGIRLGGGLTRNANSLPSIDNASGNNTIPGVVYEASSAVIRSSAGKLTIAGTVTVNNNTGGSTAQKPVYLVGAGDGEISGRVQNGGRPVSVVLSGTGTWTLSNPNTGSTRNNYAGDTTINSGTLLINTDNTLATGIVTVNATGTLGGNGIVGGDTTAAAGSFLAPIGTLSFSRNTAAALNIAGLASGTGGLLFDLGSSASSDSIVLTGADGVLTIGDGVLDLNDFVFTTSAGFGDGDYVLFSTNQPIVGSLGPVTAGTLNGIDVQLVIADNGTDLVLAVPEPSSLGLLGIGAFGLIRRSRRKIS